MKICDKAKKSHQNDSYNDSRVIKVKKMTRITTLESSESLKSSKLLILQL